MTWSATTRTLPTTFPARRRGLPAASTWRSSSPPIRPARSPPVAPATSAGRAVPSTGRMVSSRLPPAGCLARGFRDGGLWDGEAGVEGEGMLAVLVCLAVLAGSVEGAGQAAVGSGLLVA